MLKRSYQLIKPLLFNLDAEKAHHLTLSIFNTSLQIPILKSLFDRRKNLPASTGKKLMGLSFSNPVGLAAGFDKDARYIDQMARLGFGFIEIGTVTPRPQVGNPKPRLFRLPKDQALINRMGFNNDGVDAAARRLENLANRSVIIGGNIGKNKDTPNAEAAKDYVICFERLGDLVDYFVVNVSSPNTPGLRSLQDKEPLRKILLQLQECNAKLSLAKPILLKISPDLAHGQLDDIIDLVDECDLTGIVATNTTIERKPLQTDPTFVSELGNGGLSGAPLLNKSNEFVKVLRDQLPTSRIIIGVGGICSGEDAIKKFNAGADLIQVYSGLIYAGPTLIADILDELVDLRNNK